ncbi:MAG: hypothetical protein K9M07_03245 [Simkaniaceae bacterium]|nr:hypothetical protein [Simkaniaceae bacterium]
MAAISPYLELISEVEREYGSSIVLGINEVQGLIAPHQLLYSDGIFYPEAPLRPGEIRRVLADRDPSFTLEILNGQPHGRFRLLRRPVDSEHSEWLKK